jgi:rod shape-determining protein MreC
VFGTLLIISVGMMGISDTGTAHDLQSAVNFVAMPAETAINNAADTVGSYWSALTQIDRLASRNKQLEDSNLTLQEELDRMGAISKLNDDWTKITTAAQSVPYETTPVRVIVRDLSNVGEQTLIVNKGSSDGLAAGQVVIDAGGALIGRIQKVEATVSTVLLISDPTSVVVGKEAKSGVAGTIRGSISSKLQMSIVNVALDVAATMEGKPVVTAGEDLPGTCDISPYPPGLLIGTITTVTKDPNLVVQTATLTPAAHLADATFLLVIMDYQGGFLGALSSACPTASPGPSTSPGPSAGAGGSALPRGASPSPAIKPSIKPSPTPGPS